MVGFVLITPYRYLIQRKISTAMERSTLWIHSSLLGCTTRVDVQLLKEPSSSSPVSIRIGADVVVQPMAIKGQWVKVKHTNSRNKTFTGWVKASSLCGNPVSLCM